MRPGHRLLSSAVLISVVAWFVPASAGATTSVLAAPGVACQPGGTSYADVYYYRNVGSVSNNSTSTNIYVTCPVSLVADRCHLYDGLYGVVTVRNYNATYDFYCYLVQVNLDNGSVLSSGIRYSSYHDGTVEQITVDQDPSTNYRSNSFVCLVPYKYSGVYSQVLGYQNVATCDWNPS